VVSRSLLVTTLIALSACAHFEGPVVLWLVVGTDGLPQQIKVQRSLGMGLDEKAVRTVRQWRLQPATKEGKPVPVTMNVQINFRLTK